MYPLQSAQIRNAVLYQACSRAVDVAMRKLHDMPAVTEYLHAKTGVPPIVVGRVAADRFHERMKTDPSNCRWCGLAAREALAEMEEVE